MMERQIKIKRLITLALIIDFAIVLITGILMLPFISAILSSTIDLLIRRIHTISGIIMGILTLLHIWIELKLAKIIKKKNAQLEIL